MFLSNWYILNNFLPIIIRFSNPMPVYVYIRVCLQERDVYRDFQVCIMGGVCWYTFGSGVCITVIALIIRTGKNND
jgi:hypothetical protein